MSAAASSYLFKPSYAIGSVPSLPGHSQMRTDGVHRRESAGTGPVVIKVVPVTDAALPRHGPINVRLSFLVRPTIGMKWAC